MALFSIDVSDAVRPQPVPAGEYLLRISAMTVEQTPKVRFLKVKLRVDTDVLPDGVILETTPRGITHNIMFPDGKSDDVDSIRKVEMKEFLEAFGMDTSGEFDTDAFVGTSAYAALDQEGEEGIGYGVSNIVKRWTRRD